MPHCLNDRLARRPGPRPWLRGPALALALSAGPACQTLGPPDALPASATLLAPPSPYQLWWAATESCSSLTGDFSRITWYVVPDVQTFDTPEGPRVGLWSHSSEGVRIILAGAYQNHELVVRHEMLHALLDQEGHPGEYFVDRCHLTWESWSGTTGG